MVVALAVGSVMFTGCSAGVEVAGPAADLPDGSWTLVTLTADAGVLAVPPGRVTMTLEGTQASGTAGCNTYRFGFASVGRSFDVIDGISTTKLLCRAEGVMELEQTFLRLLAASETQVNTPEMLTIDGPEGTLEFAVAG